MIAMQTITSGEVLAIYTDIFNARGTNRARGDFLTTFAEAVVRADMENLEVLMPAAIRLILKYRLGPPLATAIKGVTELVQSKEAPGQVCKKRAAGCEYDYE